MICCLKPLTSRVSDLSNNLRSLLDDAIIVTLNHSLLSHVNKSFQTKPFEGCDVCKYNLCRATRDLGFFSFITDLLPFFFFGIIYSKVLKVLKASKRGRRV